MLEPYVGCWGQTWKLVCTRAFQTGFCKTPSFLQLEEGPYQIHR